jgi:uncharacterized C2H2 Zn-finger protein
MDQEFACKMCDAKFMTEEELNAHVADVHGMATEATEATDATGAEAMDTMPEDAKCTCEKCGMVCDNQEMLDEHIKTAHPAEEAPAE